MKGGFYQAKGRKTWRVWIPWKGEKIFVNKSLDGTTLDTKEKAEAVLQELNKQIMLAMFDPILWKKGSAYKTEWEVRQLTPHYDRVGICAICGEKTKVCQDHDHLTGLIRGKLCRTCNLGIGVLKENKEALLGALKYLMFWEKQDKDRETYEGWKVGKRYNQLKREELTEEGKNDSDKTFCVYCGRKLVNGKCLCGRRQPHFVDISIRNR
jgi:hypothetical protein